MFKEYLFEDFISKEKKSLISGPFGSNISAKFFVDCGVPVIRGNNLSVGFKRFIDDGFVYVTKEKANELNTYAICDDIVFTAVGTLGQVGIIPISSKYPKYIISNKQLRVRLDVKKLEPMFAFYWFTTPWMVELIKTRNVGSTVPLINLGIVRGLPIRLPNDFNYQRKLVKFLSDVDTKIELNNKINTELEAMAKLIYDYWFVQFEFPNEEGKPYKSSGGKMFWNEELKREVPEGWEVKRLGKVLRTELGGTPSTKDKDFWDGEFPWLNSGEITNFPIIDSDLKITESGIKNSATTLMPKGTCVLSITRHLRPSILGVDSCANQSVVGLFESEKLKNSFIYPYLVNDIPRLMTLRSGAQQPHINKGTVDDSKIIIPTETILDQYYSIVDSYYDKILNNAFQVKQLAELRDWLLPMLMNGQVKVK